jgi:pimeloyl-ACP methyl ester carboxylesterase
MEHRMSTSSMQRFAVIVLATCLFILAGCAHQPNEKQPKAEISFVEVSPGMTLRRMLVRNPNPKGTVLLLHGFPETVFAWKDIALILASEYEVHAFDWPGYGLSSRPPAEDFSYAPREYARVLKDYIGKAGITAANLTIYATDIGALPVLLLALEEPHLAKAVIVGDFAPFNRPEYMHENLQSLKSKPSSDLTRAVMNRNRDEILENASRRGLPKDEQFELSAEFKADMYRGWSHGSATSADAFYHYYSHFTSDQTYFESNVARLKAPLKVIWGERDFYIKKEMGIEFARKANADIAVLPGLGHYPHLQSPARTIEEIRAASQ